MSKNYFMRKFNTKRLPNPLHLHSQPVQRQEIRYSEKGERKRYKLDPIETFHSSLLDKQSFLQDLKGKRSAKNSLHKINQNESDTFKQSRHEIDSIKKQIARQKIENQEKQAEMLSSILTRLKESIHQNRYSSIPPPQQIMYPVPMPLNFPAAPSYYQPPAQKSSRRNQMTRQSFRNFSKNDSFYLRNNQILKKENKAERIKRNLRRWKKVANAILFTILLRKFGEKLRQNRLLNFEKIKKTLKTNLEVVRKDISKLMIPFFNVLLQKKDVCFDFEEDEPKEIRRQKISSIKKLLVMALEAVEEWMKNAVQNPKFVQTLYYLCKHGNYSCREPILTRQELDLSCLSQKFKYISADSNLQISAFLNTIIIKVTIFNVLLKPSRISEELDTNNIIENIEIISTILYEITLDLQDTFLMLVPKCYKIGNFDRLAWVKEADPLLYNCSQKVQGQLISGLRGQNWMVKNFKKQKWVQEKKFLNSCISHFKKMMIQFHYKISRNFM